MSVERIAQKFAQARSGYDLVSYGEVGLPFYRIAINAHVLEHKRITPFAEFALRSVFAGVSECPYCHEDPSGEVNTCSYCNKRIAIGVAKCPYCGNYTDDQGPRGSAGGQRFPRIYVIAGWLVVIAFVLPLLIALVHWASSR